MLGVRATPLYGQAAVLPPGITPDQVYAIIGTPRTKYGFLDAWLVRGTYHVEGGTLRDGTGKLVAGGNQHSRTWAESITPEVAAKIATWVPGFPTKLEEFGDNGSKWWGVTSYGAKNGKSMLFQPATSYCEVCHSFKFDFKSQAELIAALGKPEELRKHTINKGISCEECHGAGAHLVGARIDVRAVRREPCSTRGGAASGHTLLRAPFEGGQCAGGICQTDRPVQIHPFGASGGVVMQGRIPGRMLAQYTPWFSKSSPPPADGDEPPEDEISDAENDA